MNDIEPVHVKKGKSFSTLWLLPIIALLITLWLGWQAYLNHGDTITIVFNNGNGIQANKTKVMYKGIAIGKVTDVSIDKNTQKIVIQAEIDKEALPFIGKDSQFWLVSPRVSFTGVSGLETIISGTYIEVNAVKGEPETKFTALDTPPSSSLFETTKGYINQLIN